jgi:riboflavin kinase
MQTQRSQALVLTTDTTTTTDSFIQHQKAVFDEMADYFSTKEATPPEIVPVMRHLAQRIMFRSKNQVCRVLDIGCGTGALFPFYLQAANDLNVTLNLMGVDLSPKMTALAKDRAVRILSKTANQKHSIHVLEYEFLTMMRDDDDNDDDTTTHTGVYDTVVANACFGNFLDSTELLEAMTKSLKVGGALYITHPLGANFVQQLHDKDPTTVPNVLPTLQELQSTPLALKVVDFEEKDRFGNLIYLACLTKLQEASFGNAIYTLQEGVKPQLIRLRGMVASGYGRGGKKLGFPTANLPESLFQDSLKSVSTGVYFGWAALEAYPDTIYKAAVNVGYSPTFQGKENVEKIVEAHLIVPEEAGKTLHDFYNSTMRLSLSGFLRNEEKFASFGELVAQIQRDVANANDALSMEPFSLLQNDPFLVNSEDMWVGTSGGDETASWEFQEFQQALQELLQS